MLRFLPPPNSAAMESAAAMCNEMSEHRSAASRGKYLSLIGSSSCSAGHRSACFITRGGRRLSVTAESRNRPSSVLTKGTLISADPPSVRCSFSLRVRRDGNGRARASAPWQVSGHPWSRSAHQIIEAQQISRHGVDFIIGERLGVVIWHRSADIGEDARRIGPIAADSA